MVTSTSCIVSSKINTVYIKDMAIFGEVKLTRINVGQVDPDKSRLSYQLVNSWS